MLTALEDLYDILGERGTVTFSCKTRGYFILCSFTAVESIVSCYIFMRRFNSSLENVVIKPNLHQRQPSYNLQTRIQIGWPNSNVLHIDFVTNMCTRLYAGVI